MSLRFVASYNSPPLVAAAGVAVVLGFPSLKLTTASLAALKGANSLAFLTNVVAVSIPGRLDGQEQQQQQQQQQQNVMNAKDKEASKQQQRDDKDNPYFSNRTRTLVNPSGYAFSIWLPIYLGETIFVISQALTTPESSLALSVLPQVTAPFVAANLTQSLWCAAFRPSYNHGWHKYISAGLLASTAYSLDLVHQVTASAEEWSPLFIPLTMHYGWMCAASLVNLNGSLAMSSNVSDATLSYVGHASIVVATTLGVGITLSRSSPTFGLTLAWALAACAKGMTQRLETKSSLISKSIVLQKGAQVQRTMCWVGTVACIGASVIAILQ